jgi:hypothetical protein
MHTTGIIQSLQAFFYVHVYRLQYIWRIPLAFLLPLLIPFCSLSNPLLLTWNPPRCDRICPPRSQVACKLTPLSQPFPQSLPPQIPRTQTTQRLTETTLRRIRCLLSGTCIYTHLHMIYVLPFQYMYI